MMPVSPWVGPLAMAVVFVLALYADHRYHPRTRREGLRSREAARRRREMEEARRG